MEKGNLGAGEGKKTGRASAGTDGTKAKKRSPATGPGGAGHQWGGENKKRMKKG